MSASEFAWWFLAEAPCLTRTRTPRIIPRQDENSRSAGLFCKSSHQSSYYPTIQTLDQTAQDYLRQPLLRSGIAGPTKEQLSTRLYALLSVPQVRRMLDTSHNKLDLLDAINRRKTVLVNTAGLGEWTPLFGRVIIALALQAAYRRDIATEPHPALLFVRRGLRPDGREDQHHPDPLAQVWPLHPFRDPTI